MIHKEMTYQSTVCIEGISTLAGSPKVRSYLLVRGS